MNKLVIAFNCFFKILFNRIFYENVKNLIMSDKAKELEDRGYINSVEPKSPIRIKFNSHFASEVIPEIFPKM